MNARIFLTVGLIVICALPLAAQDKANMQSGVSFGPQVGLYKVHDSDGMRFMGGVAMRVRAAILGVEASVNFRQDEYNDGSVEATSWPVMVTGLIYPIPIAYGAIGAGWYSTTFQYTPPPGSTDDFGDETKQEFGWHFGGGLELPIGAETAKLVTDIRYVFLNYEFDSFPGTEENANFLVITAGVLFNL
jgi:opacity protein-like surface antigen